MRKYATSVYTGGVRASASQEDAAVPGDWEPELFGLHAELCKVLTDPKRLALISALRAGERCVGDLAESSRMALPNASQHLSVLRHAGLVSVRREGTTVYYRLIEPRILQACDIVQAIVGDRVSPQYDRERDKEAL